MTRELNVRITLSEDKMRWTDREYEDIICDAIEEKTSNYQVCVDVHTVTPESANPKEGECKYLTPSHGCKCRYGNEICPISAKENRLYCKFYDT